jgi:WXG100 family type VII secretion target
MGVRPSSPALLRLVGSEAQITIRFQGSQSMAQFHVNSDDLAAKSQTVRISIETLRAEVDTMQRNLLDLQSSWSGAAATNFQNLMADWRNTQLRVEASLESINAALSMAATQYAQAEEANTRLFIP